jgi:hypothetical protein
MKFRITSEYGELSEVREGIHNGIDISMKSGTELRSFMDGVVIDKFDGSTNIGEGVKIRLENGQEAIYGHMSDVSVSIGQRLDKGDLIGLSGSTGNSTGGHLHFGIKENGQFIDPTNYYDSIVAMSGDQKGFITDKFNQVSDWVIQKEVEFIFKPLGNALKDLAIMFCDWLTASMPNIGFMIAVLTGVIIMITGKAVKPLIWGTIGLTVVIIWLSNAYS